MRSRLACEKSSQASMTAKMFDGGSDNTFDKQKEVAGDCGEGSGSGQLSCLNEKWCRPWRFPSIHLEIG